MLEVLDLNPEYAVGSMVLDLLQAEQLEAQQVGLKCLYLVSGSTALAGPPGHQCWWQGSAHVADVTCSAQPHAVRACIVCIQN